ncbi:hypothetical protein H310_07868 [Aphanomyces invadans]|uniref:JmjC domain-containing protein n=1 Tax=Aphanomyces invadans TaxID=157072 RepID=A0A024U1R5_9STRA|nr:hypothetical protein H310_07868 [Aphanomyces invadans]ETV99826.1 hypothetical protein H310_07868 [Aphanomyces invadans]|eukprot:XP_008871602.1 hypothetical protein H310_07868 [Aphanomyces invadans]
MQVEDVLLERAAASADKEAWERAGLLAEEAVHRIWDRLHQGKWNDVDPQWRQRFAIACELLATSYLHKPADAGNLNNHETAIEILDTGLLMAGPYGRHLHDTMDKIVADVDSSSTTDSTHPAKKTKTSVGVLPPALTPNLTTDSPLCTSLKRVKAPSLLEFKASYMTQNCPVIITDAMDEWPAMGKTHDGRRHWANLNYLCRVAGRRTVPIEVGSSYLEDNWSQTLMTLHKFIDEHILHPPSHNAPTGYLAQHALFEQIPQLRKDIAVPDYCALSVRGRQDVDADDDDDDVDDVVVNAWFGPPNTISPLHFDPAQNLLCQIVGSKYVRLYASTFSDHLYPVPGYLSNTSQVVVEGDGAQANAVQFPRFLEAPYWEGVLGPGEMLYIPPRCWHYIRSLDVSFSVSFWWD